ncbi:MAG: RHS repeat-associated core domain-containing protein [Steroidobacteraceae bacterium]
MAADRLQKNAHRYDGIASGRMYVQSDPIGLNGGVNTYTYVEDNPLDDSDPSGLDGCYVEFSDYPIVIPNTKISLPLGHAGVVAYDPATGATRYYEYGRYETDNGEVERRYVPDLVIGPDGKPTPASMKKLLDYLSKHQGKGKPAESECRSDADFNKIVNFAEKFRKDPNRPPYSWNPLRPNHCKTFARKAIEAGRAK